MPEPVGPGAAGELGQKLPECWSQTEKSWARPPDLATDKKTSKTGLTSLKPAGLFLSLSLSLSLSKVIIYYHFLNYFFFLLTHCSSLSFILVLLLLSLPLYLFFLPSIFFNHHK